MSCLSTSGTLLFCTIVEMINSAKTYLWFFPTRLKKSLYFSISSFVPSASKSLLPAKGSVDDDMMDGCRRLQALQNQEMNLVRCSIHLNSNLNNIHYEPCEVGRLGWLTLSARYLQYIQPAIDTKYMAISIHTVSHVQNLSYMNISDGNK